MTKQMSDFADMIQKKVQEEREKRFNDNMQLSLGRMIEICEKIKSQNSSKKLDRVVYDFGYLCPTSINSWRGSYDELALDYENFTSYDPEIKPLTLDEFIRLLKDCVGKQFTGYKGGEFRMSESTPVWVSNWGDASETAVIDITYDGCCNVIIHTMYMEY